MNVDLPTINTGIDRAAARATAMPPSRQQPHHHFAFRSASEYASRDEGQPSRHGLRRALLHGSPSKRFRLAPL